jgi:protein SDA1
MEKQKLLSLDLFISDFLSFFFKRQSMGKRNKAELLASNLAQLQNLIKRDRNSYHEEFITQYRHFESSIEIFKLKPDQESDKFAELVMFIAAVSTCYRDECKEFPKLLISLLEEYCQQMNAELRQKMVQALILMRNRDFLEPISLLSLFFKLFSCKDKSLRQLLHTHIVSDIKNSNAKAKNNKLNKTLQNFMYKMLQDASSIAAKKSLEVMIELYLKNVWNDSKTVNVVAEACLSPVPKLIAPAVHFFLGTNEEKFKEDEDEDDIPDINNMKKANIFNKKKKSRLSQLDKAKSVIKRKERQRNRVDNFNFSALHLINDPQEFAEKLFSKLRQVTQKNLLKFELRLELMNLISRLIGVHKLILLGFYEFLISYIKPHQKEVTQILAFVAQASHDLVPPDSLEAIVRAIADNFVWSNCATEVVTAGLNSLREVCVRSPLAMPEELLKSLIDDYKNHRDKGPMTAARSLLGLYREFNPEMLKRKDRGKSASINMKNHKVLNYGQIKAYDDVVGAELLELPSDEDENSDEEIPELVPAFGESSVDNGEWEDIESDDGSVPSDDELDWDALSVEEMEGDENEDIEGEILESEVDIAKDNDCDASPRPAKKQKVSLATQKIFTDEDFAKIRERKEQRDAEKLTGFKPKNNDSDDDEFVDVSKIMQYTKKKDDYEARLLSIKVSHSNIRKGVKVD